MVTKRLCTIMLLLVMTIFATTQVYAETLAPTNTTAIQQSVSQESTKTPEASVQSQDSFTSAGGSQTSSGNTGSAIKPVSPSEITGKVDRLVGKAHEAGKPMMVRISQVMMVVVAFMLVLSIFLGGKMLQKSFFAIFCVGLGLFIYINAASLTGMVVWMSEYMGR